jgi:arsenite-transporting ATPase
LIFEKGDASSIFYKGKVFEFIREDFGLRLRLKVPFTDKDGFEIIRYGEQLSIKVRGPIGHIVNVIPLPAATIGMNLAQSKLVKDELDIFFER